MENISEKLTALQKNFYDLNNLFELSIIATQAESLEDLVDKITDFIIDTLGLTNIHFFVNHNKN